MTFKSSRGPSPDAEPISRSRSAPGRLATDGEIERLFAEAADDDAMSAYEGADVTVHGEGALAPTDDFVGSGINNSVLLNVALIGYKRPTLVQRHTIPYVLAGRDVIITAQTGSGKTAAFVLPILTTLLELGTSRDPSALILVPTRELAQQIETETCKFAKRTGLRTACVFGGAPLGPQIRQLRDGCDVLIATPGRIIDVLERNCLSLSSVRFLVLDEADRMLDMGFEPQIRRVIDEFDMPPADNRQTLLFSATFADDVRRLAAHFMRRQQVRVEVGMQQAPAQIEQRFLRVPQGSKLSTLLDVLRDVDGQTVVFAARKVDVDGIEDYLYDEGVAVVGIHGDRDMKTRQDALRWFATGRAKIMVATDVAARGLDLPDVAHVVNMDLPGDVDTYTHRVGRTGRAGRPGLATSFWNDNDVTFLGTFVRQLRASRAPVPEGLEQFEGERRFAQARPGYRRSTWAK